MNFRRGFTIVEIVIVMVIMAVLIGLAVLNISSTQANARDNERKTDAENIARGLETRYKEGNPVVTAIAGYSDPSTIVGPGTYPGVNEFFHMLGWNRTGWTPLQVIGGYGTKNLPGTSMQSFLPPGFSGSYSGVDVVCASACTYPPETQSQTDAIFADTTKQLKYYYEPIDASGGICSNGPCVRFNLYYWQEKQGTYITIRSKHQ